MALTAAELTSAGGGACTTGGGALVVEGGGAMTPGGIVELVELVVELGGIMPGGRAATGEVQGRAHVVSEAVCYCQCG